MRLQLICAALRQRSPALSCCRPVPLSSTNRELGLVRDPKPGYCTREYEPVCARRYGERRTFANACLASRAGYQIIRRGECRNEGGGSDQPRFCTREYRPVCARQNGVFRTFGNACEADAADWRVVGNGEC